jgi:hypothetical protein
MTASVTLQIRAGETSTRIPFLQLDLDVAGGHAARLQRQDFRSLCLPAASGHF